MSQNLPCAFKVHFARIVIFWNESRITKPWAVPAATRPHSRLNPMELMLAGGEIWRTQLGWKPEVIFNSVDLTVNALWPFQMNPSFSVTWKINLSFCEFCLSVYSTQNFILQTINIYVQIIYELISTNTLNVQNNRMNPIPFLRNLSMRFVRPIFMLITNDRYVVCWKTSSLGSI